MNNEDTEKLLVEYKNTVKRLRYLYIKLEDKIKKEKGLSEYDTILYLDNQWKQAIKNAVNEQRQQEQNQLELEQSSNLKDNNNNNNSNIPLHLIHFQ